MIKTKKIILNGLSIDKESIADFGLEAIVLNRLELMEDLDTPLGKARGLLTSSKISKFTNDYDFIDIVPFRKHVESMLCAIINESIIYCDREGRNIVFKTTSNNNTYSIDSFSYGWRQCGDKFYISEGLDNKWELISCFDKCLNIIGREKIHWNQNHISKENNLETNEKALNEFMSTNPDINLLFTKINNINKRNDFMTHCYDKKDKKDYFINFSKEIKESWRIEIPNGALVSEYYPSAGGFYYGTYSLDKIGHKWRVIKIDRNGIIVDCFDFRGADPICTNFNEKLAIVFDDIENFNDWQKELLKEKQYIGPSGIIVLEN